MTLGEAIRRADEIRPNPFIPSIKINWISELEGKTALEVHLLDVSETQKFRYTEADFEKELLIPFPHDSLYVDYLLSRIDFEVGEYNRYMNDKEMFDTNYREYIRWFAATYKPAQGNNGGKCKYDNMLH